MSAKASFILRVTIAAIIGGALMGLVVYIALFGRQATPATATKATTTTKTVTLATTSGHASTRDTVAPCGGPSARPTRSFTPDGYVHVRVRNGASWVRGTSNKRPNALALASGSTVTLDRNTRLVQPCVGNTCYAYVGLRPKTHVAEWIFGISHWGNDPANVTGGVWDVSHDQVIMSNGLRVRRSSQLIVPPIAEIRQSGGVEFVFLDDQGDAQQIGNNGCL